MIEIKVSWPLNKTQKEIDSFSKAVIKNIDGAIKDAAMLIAGYAKKNIQGGIRSGVSYTVGGKTGIRSAPGEWPKSDTGRLANSIRADHSSFLSSSVGSDVAYSEFLEKGTNKMAPRPWLARSFNENKDTIDKLISAAMEQA